MASEYSSGSAASFADVATAMINFLVARGWSSQSSNVATGRILSRGDLFLWVDSFQDWLAVYPGKGRNGSTGALTGRPNASATNHSNDGVMIASPVDAPIVFPINYEMIWHDDPTEEFYLIVSYGGDKYQHINFGKSNIAGIGGTGLWLTGTWRSDGQYQSPGYSRVYIGVDNNTQGTGQIYLTPSSGISGGFFYAGNGFRYYSDYVNHSLEPGNWAGGNGWSSASQPGQVGGLMNYNRHNELLVALPSTFNEAEVLIPCTCSLFRPDGLVTPVVNMNHARKLRIDNVQPGEVVTYGADQWKVYPLYAKNTIQRDGVGWATGANHSGTLGVAIRLPEA